MQHLPAVDIVFDQQNRAGARGERSAGRRNCRRERRERDFHRGSGLGRALELDFPPVELNDLRGDRQPEVSGGLAWAFEDAIAMIEVENMLQLIRRYRVAIVMDREDRQPTLLGRHPNLNRPPAALNGALRQVPERLKQSISIPADVHFRAGQQNQLNLRHRGGGRQGNDDVLRQVLEAKRSLVELHLSRLQA